MISFTDFFKTVHGWRPFRWQEMLAEKVMHGEWPEAVNLPTASGKTALIDVAVWSLAAQADRPAHERTTPRRIWFVVDRRIVVDEAFDRANRIAQAIDAKENRNTLASLRDALRSFGRLGSDSDTPSLAAARLRGGVRRDERWSESLSQPAVLTSTVDQFGSRLLFRPYGHGTSSASVHAALAGTDSLLVLDEAHCAVPLLETVRAVSNYQSAAWTPEPVATRLRPVVMSATLPPELTDVFPVAAERAAALEHPLLQERITAPKPARLVLADGPKKPARGPRPASVLVPEACVEVQAAIEAGKRRIAVMFNRVDSAEALHSLLATTLAGKASVHLLTGRMRPVDRDERLAALHPVLASSRSDDAPLPADLPIVLCTTQCLEVGADFSFDALVTECAAIDALRQRVGRLDRLGKETKPPFAAILAWAPDVPEPASLDDEEPLDPIYGNAAARTWAWLNERAAASAVGTIDLGISALDTSLPANVRPLLAPVSHAPVLLPSHLDAWVQTGPEPAASADPAFFLHGCEAAMEDTIDVIWRRDLTPASADERDSDLVARWRDTVDAAPPLAGERLPVRRGRLVRVLAGHLPTDESFDIEGVTDGPLANDPESASATPFFCIRGSKQKTVEIMSDPRALRPGDTVVLPAADRVPETLGNLTVRGGSVDAYEAALALAGRPPRVRLDSALLGAIGKPAAELRAWLATPIESRTQEDLWDSAESLCESLEASQDATPADLLAVALRAVLNAKTRDMQAHPAGGLILLDTAAHAVETGDDPFADETDGRSLVGCRQSLPDHTGQVAEVAGRMADACFAPELAATVRAAAVAHDAGKADPRFQSLLHRRGIPLPTTEPLAKSPGGPTDRALRKRLHAALDLPENWRHEALSLRLAELAPRPDGVDDEHADLFLHLIAAHHGHARPSLPVTDDPGFPGLTFHGIEVSRDAWQNPAPHHLSAGTEQRFWSLCRKHGWWGLAALEAALRLADWHASARPKHHTHPDADGGHADAER